ncbi:MAG: exosome complex RNA-binding protein Rrp4 [Nanobdellota archaeon]
MSELFVKEKEIVAPGQKLASGMDYIPAKGAYRKEDDIYAQEVGLIHIDGRAIKLVPLAGAYVPKVDDVIIVKVIDIAMSGWRVDTGSAYSGMISLRDGSSDFITRGANLTKYFDIDDYAIAKVTSVTSQMLVDLTTIGPGLRKIKGGQIIEVGCRKVPRVIGKKGSMVSVIKQVTGCQIKVGQNGRIWINGDPKSQMLAAETIYKISDEAHTSGLTEKIEAYLKKRADELGIVSQEEEKSNEGDDNEL